MYQVDNEKFGTFLRELRIAKGMTQKELAEKLYVSDKAVSKWERGQSMPEISLLVPLSQILGVTTTELLSCERIDSGRGLNISDVEQIVEKTIRLSEPKAPEREDTSVSIRLAVWGACAAAAAAECFMLLPRFGVNVMGTPDVLVVEGLMMFFSFYFFFLAPKRLPNYYDENKISVFYHNGMKMSMPGIYFNNRNWPYIVASTRKTMLAVMVCYPVIFLALFKLIPRFEPLGAMIFMFISVFSFIVPIYVAAKRYE